MQSIPEPVLDPAGFEVYEPKVKVEEGRSADGRYMAARNLEYILIPERGGRLEIPALSVTYFDPAAHSYRTASTAPIEIRSRGGAGTEAGGKYDLTRREIERLGSDIRHIKPDVERIGAGPALYRSLWYWIAHILLPLGYVALVARHRHRRRLVKDTGYARRRRSGGALSGRLREARRRAAEGDGFHAALQEAVVAFIADHADLPAPGLTPDRCRRQLEERGLGPDLVNRVAAVLERWRVRSLLPRRQRQVGPGGADGGGRGGRRPDAQGPVMRGPLLVAALWLALAPGGASAQSAALGLYSEGNDLYRRGEFAAARTRYLAAAGTGVRDARLFYNLGNACFKDGRLGEAVVWYERARRLAPRDEDVLANLRFLRRVKRDREEEGDGGFLYRLYLYPTLNELFAALSLSLAGLCAAAGWRLVPRTRGRGGRGSRPLSRWNPGVRSLRRHAPLPGGHPLRGGGHRRRTVRRAAAPTRGRHPSSSSMRAPRSPWSAARGSGSWSAWATVSAAGCPVSS